MENSSLHLKSNNWLLSDKNIASYDKITGSEHVSFHLLQKQLQQYETTLSVSPDDPVAREVSQNISVEISIKINSEV